MQSQLFDSELERKELKTAYRILQDRLSHSLEKNQKIKEERLNNTDRIGVNKQEI